MDEVLVVESEKGERGREKDEDKDIHVVTSSDYTQSKTSIVRHFLFPFFYFFC
jgi:hypothetical protein